MSPDGAFDIDATGEVASFPAHWEADVVLSNGRTCHVRPVRPADGAALTKFFQGLSEETLRLRYFTPNPDLAAKETAKLMAIDHRDHVALAAFARGEVVGVGTYDLVGRSEAEIAFTIRDDHQGAGLGSILLEHLAAVARENGVYRFTAEVLADNKRMLATFDAAGYLPSSTVEEGVAKIDFDIDPTAKTRAVSRRREQRADANSVRALLEPKGIAVLCEDVSEGSTADRVVDTIKRGGFAGGMTVVSPGGQDMQGIPGRASLADADGAFDLAVVIMPRDRAEAAVDECAAGRVRGIVAIRVGSDGFDFNQETRLTQKARAAGMRVIGPRSLGVINTDPRVSMNASLREQMPQRGRVALFSQSAAFGDALLTEAARRGIGVSGFVSVGNGADVCACDMLQYWLDDEGTAIAVLHLESMRNPRKVARIARGFARTKPVLAVRSGRSMRVLSFAQAPRSTGLPPLAIDQIFGQAGIIQVDNVTELADTAALVSLQPLPAGDRVAVVSDSVSLGRLAVDTCLGLGLVPVGEAHYCDPDDLPALRDAIDGNLRDPGVDVLVAVHGSGMRGDAESAASLVARCARDSTKPVVAVALGASPEPLVDGDKPEGLSPRGSVPVFGDVESAFRAIGAVVNYVRWLGEPQDEAPSVTGVDTSRAHAIAAGRLRRRQSSESSDELNAAEVADLLAAYGVDLLPMIPVHSEEQAVMAAHSLGFPVVLRTTQPRLDHRVTLGGVRLNLENERSLRTAFLSMVATLPREAAGQLAVQRMVPPGVDCVIDAVEDPLFGPALLFRIAGPIPVLLSDFGCRIPPVSASEALGMTRQPRASSLLDTAFDSATGGSSVDRKALADLLVRIGRLGDDLPEIVSLRLNPVIVHAKGLSVLRARARVARPEARTDLEARRL